MLETQSRALSVFAYQGANITFQRGGALMVNATEMAKPFGKRVAHWLANQQTDELISCVSAKVGIPTLDLVVVQNGGNNPGTWLHEDLALIFAQWLSPQFYLWCNDRIKELMSQGVATLNNEDETILHAMRVLEQRVQASKQRIQALEGEVEHQQTQIAVLSPKAEYTDKVLNATGTLTTNVIARKGFFYV